jgi:hypothetical protein
MSVYLLCCPFLSYNTGHIPTSEIPKIYLAAERLIQLHPISEFCIHTSEGLGEEDVAEKMSTYINTLVSTNISEKLNGTNRQISSFIEEYSNSDKVEIGVAFKKDLKHYKPEIKWYNFTLYSFEQGIINYYKRLGV